MSFQLRAFTVMSMIYILSLASCGSNERTSSDPAFASYYDELVIFQAIACTLQVECTDSDSICHEEIDIQFKNVPRSMSDAEFASCLLSVRNLECPNVWPPIETAECAVGHEDSN